MAQQNFSKGKKIDNYHNLHYVIIMKFQSTSSLLLSVPISDKPHKLFRILSMKFNIQTYHLLRFSPLLLLPFFVSFLLLPHFQIHVFVLIFFPSNIPFKCQGQIVSIAERNIPIVVCNSQCDCSLVVAVFTIWPVWFTLISFVRKATDFISTAVGERKTLSGYSPPFPVK